jgi:hypothetical protein
MRWIAGSLICKPFTSLTTSSSSRTDITIGRQSCQQILCSCFYSNALVRPYSHNRGKGDLCNPYPSFWYPTQRERIYIWKQRRSIPTYLFYLFRYSTPIISIINLIGEHAPWWTGSICANWIWLPVASGVIVSAATGSMFASMIKEYPKSYLCIFSNFEWVSARLLFAHIMHTHMEHSLACTCNLLAR